MTGSTTAAGDRQTGESKYSEEGPVAEPQVTSSLRVYCVLKNPFFDYIIESSDRRLTLDIVFHLFFSFLSSHDSKPGPCASKSGFTNPG